MEQHEPFPPLTKFARFGAYFLFAGTADSSEVQEDHVVIVDDRRGKELRIVDDADLESFVLLELCAPPARFLSSGVPGSRSR